MKILLTNDDGINAPGLRALFESVQFHFGDAVTVVVVAPDRGRSECGHSVTTGRPLGVERIDDGWFAVDGTPVDCVRAAFASLAPNVDLVVSGVNAGANLGIDLLVSGTVAAAREAAVHGISAMAVSHYRRPDVPVTWNHVPGWLTTILEQFSETARRSSQSLLWNVNLPAIDPALPSPSMVRCAVDTRPLKRIGRSVGAELHFDSDFHGRPREKGSDVERCFSGEITISELSPHPS